MKDAENWILRSCYRIQQNRDKERESGWSVMNIEWNYSYYQPWFDNEWLVDEMLAMREEMLIIQDKDITMQ